MAKSFQELLQEETTRRANVKAGKVKAPEPTLEDFEFSPIPVPNLSETKQRIDNRGNVMDALRDIKDTRVDLFRPFDEENPVGNVVNNIMATPSEVSLRGLSTIGTGFRLLESAVSGSLMAGLEGKPENMAEEFAKGLKGEKFTEMGDLLRVTGAGGRFNEPVSAAGGLIATVGLTNLASKGAVVTGAKKVQKATARAIDTKAAEKSEFVIRRADQLKEGFDQVIRATRREFRNLYDEFITNPQGQTKVPIGRNSLKAEQIEASKEIMKRLSPQIKRYNRTVGKQRGVQLNPEKGIRNIKEAQQLRNVIDDAVPNRAWTEGGTDVQEVMKGDFREIMGWIVDNVDDVAQKRQLLKLNKRWNNLQKHEKVIKSLTTKRGTGVRSSTLGSIKKKNFAGELRELKKIERAYMPEVGRILKDIDKFNTQMMLERAALLGLGGIGIAAFNRKVKTPVIEETIPVGIGAE